MLPDLFSPLLIAFSLLMGDAVLSGGPIQLREIAVPPALAARGYSQAVVRDRITVAVERIVRDSGLPPSRGLTLQSGAPAGEALAQSLQMLPMLRYIQSQIGAVEHSVGGDIVQGSGNRFAMRLLVRTGTTTILASFERPGGEEEALFEDAGFAIVRVIEPAVACAALLLRSVSAGAPNPAGAEHCLETVPRSRETARLRAVRQMVSAVRATHAFIRQPG